MGERLEDRRSEPGGTGSLSARVPMHWLTSSQCQPEPDNLWVTDSSVTRGRELRQSGS